MLVFVSLRALSAMSSAHIKKVIDDGGIIKSAEDKRLYRALELNNGMRVMLISDPQTDKSSAAMDVYIGRKFFSCTVKPILSDHSKKTKPKW